MRKLAPSFFKSKSLPRRRSPRTFEFEFESQQLDGTLPLRPSRASPHPERMTFNPTLLPVLRDETCDHLHAEVARLRAGNAQLHEMRRFLSGHGGRVSVGVEGPGGAPSAVAARLPGAPAGAGRRRLLPIALAAAAGGDRRRRRQAGRPPRRPAGAAERGGGSAGRDERRGRSRPPRCRGRGRRTTRRPARRRRLGRDLLPRVQCARDATVGRRAGSGDRQRGARIGTTARPRGGSGARTCRRAIGRAPPTRAPGRRGRDARADLLGVGQGAQTVRCVLGVCRHGKDGADRDTPRRQSCRGNTGGPSPSISGGMAASPRRRGLGWLSTPTNSPNN